MAALGNLARRGSSPPGTELRALPAYVLHGCRLALFADLAEYTSRS